MQDDTTRYRVKEIFYERGRVKLFETAENLKKDDKITKKGGSKLLIYEKCSVRNTFDKSMRK